MAVVGHAPESGVRVVLARPRSGGPPWLYEGDATTQGGRFRVTAVLEDNGELSVQLSSDAPPGLTDKVRLILRAAWRRAREDEAAPPLRLARWRADT
jgi:hypothetical protein